MPGVGFWFKMAGFCSEQEEGGVEMLCPYANPSLGRGPSSLACAALQRGWHQLLQGLGQTLSSQPLGVRSCWALLPRLHPGEKLRDSTPSSPGSTLPGSPQKEDPRPGKRRHVLCRGVRSPGRWQAACLPSPVASPARQPQGADKSRRGRSAGPAKEGSGLCFRGAGWEDSAQIASPGRLNFFSPGPRGGSSRWVRVQP